MGSHMHPSWLWRVGFLSFCDFSIFAKRSTSSWRCYIAFNFCLSMFHVDCNEETSTKWFGLVWFINMGLGCFAVVLTVLIVIAAAWTLADIGLKGNFYKPLCQI